MLLTQILRHTTANLSKSAAHDSAKVSLEARQHCRPAMRVESMKTYLVLRVQSNHACLMRTDDGLAGLDDTGGGFELKLVGDEKEEEGALEEVDAEEEGHELEAGVELENVADGLSSGHGVTSGGDEALAADPEIVVVEEVDGIPLAGEEDVEDMHDVCPVGHDDAGLDVALGHAARIGVDAVDAVHRWCPNIVRQVIGGGDTGCFGGLLISGLGLGAEAQVALLELLQALLICLEVAGDLSGLVIPLAG